MPLDQLTTKHIELMREIRPGLRRVGMLVDSSGDRCKTVEDAARQASRTLGVIFVPCPVTNRNEIEQAFVRMRSQPPDVLLPCPVALLFNNRDLLYESAIRLRIPFTSFVTATLPLGVLFSYAPSFTEGYRKAATYVDKILLSPRGQWKSVEVSHLRESAPLGAPGSPRGQWRSVEPGGIAVGEWAP